jgi:hypothetical protein
MGAMTYSSIVILFLYLTAFIVLLIAPIVGIYRLVTKKPKAFTPFISAARRLAILAVISGVTRHQGEEQMFAIRCRVDYGNGIKYPSDHPCAKYEPFAENAAER